jgi:RimJ/RimL family protein N-acetyltransferase
MILTTDRLTLRRWRPDDAAAFAAWHADAELRAWLGRERPMTLDEARADIAGYETHFDRNGFGPWAVETRDDGALIGACGLRRVPPGDYPFAPCVEILWRQARAAWGHGYMTEAARAALDDAFARVGVDAVRAWTADTNLRSRAIMQRLGMRHDASLDFAHPRLPDGHPLRPHVVYVLARAAQR